MGEEKTEGSAEEGAKAKRRQIEIDREGDTWLFEESTCKERYGGWAEWGWGEGGGIERDL